MIVEVPLHRITREVCEKHSFTLDQMREPNRAKAINAARQELMYRLYATGLYSNWKIGSHLCRDGTTVFSGRQAHAARLSNEDQTLLTTSKEFRDGLLQGCSSDKMCFMICAPLQGLLRFMGISTVMMESDLGECNHVWLKLDDGRALDPTGDQFNWVNDEKMPEIYLGPPIKIHGNAKEWKASEK